MSVSRYAGWLWLGSSLPIGLLLFLLSEPVRQQVFVVLLTLDLAHSVSPIVQAWGHAEFRRTMLKRPAKYIGRPAALLLLALVVGLATSFGYTSYHGGMYHITNWRNPYPILMNAYSAWNVWHFGMQHYGALALWRRPQSSIDAKTACLGLALAAMTVLGPVMIMTSAVNHWAVELGLGFRAMGYRKLVFSGLMAIGAAWAALVAYRNELIPLYLFPLVMCLRLVWIGGTHFLYSRWDWGPNAPFRQALAGA